jgi:hypothetical protein
MTQEEEIKQLKVAFGRMHNEIKNLTKDFYSITEQVVEQIGELKSNLKEKPRLEIGSMYQKQISVLEFIESYCYESRNYNKYFIKFTDSESYYTGSISDRYNLKVGDNIRFIVDTQIKIKQIKQL